MPMILGISTVTAYASFSLIQNGKTILEQSQYFPRLGDRLDEVVARFIETAGIVFQDINGLGVISGPGTYTGARLGVTYAKTLAQVLEIPIFGTHALDAMAQQCLPFEGLVFSILPTRKGEYVCGLFGVKAGAVARVSNDLVLTVSQLAKQLSKFQEKISVVGTELTTLSQISDIKNCYFHSDFPSGLTAAHQAEKHILEGLPSQHLLIRPIYAHQAV